MKSSPMKSGTVKSSPVKSGPERRAGLVVLALVLILMTAAMTFTLQAQEPPQEGPGAAAAGAADPVQRGHELFEAGDPKGAAELYRSALDLERPNATMVYNLGTALHHAGELPEAVLWYRRGRQDDPWLKENLFLARRSLGSENLEPARIYAWLDADGSYLAGGILVWIWGTGILALLLPAPRSRAALAAAALGTVSYLALETTRTLGPEPVVLLDDCHVGSTRLPAGTEAWAERQADGWALSGMTETICPSDSIQAVNL